MPNTDLYMIALYGLAAGACIGAAIIYTVYPLYLVAFCLLYAIAAIVAEYDG